MTKFLVKIWAYNHFGECEVESEDSLEAVENAIIDKLGQNNIKWEYLGEMNDPKINRKTYEEVINDASTSTGPIQTKEGSGPRMGAGAS